MDAESKLDLLLGLYVVALVASNLLGGKLMPIGFGDRGLTVAIVMFPLLFLVTDVVGEVYGKPRAQRFVRVGLTMLVLLLVWQLFAVSVPAAAPNDWYASFNSAYSTVFSLSITFTIASILAFVFGQYVDVAIFHLIKDRSHGPIWVRNNISTAVGQFVDTAMWTFIAFSPRLLDGSMTAGTALGAIIVPYWLAKVVFAAVDTPFMYLGVRWLDPDRSIRQIFTSPL